MEKIIILKVFKQWKFKKKNLLKPLVENFLFYSVTSKPAGRVLCPVLHVKFWLQYQETGKS